MMALAACLHIIGCTFESITCTSLDDVAVFLGALPTASKRRIVMMMLLTEADNLSRMKRSVRLAHCREQEVIRELDQVLDSRRISQA